MYFFCLKLEEEYVLYPVILEIQVGVPGVLAEPGSGFRMNLKM